ncbi:DUF2461 domain-containing protein [Permianibacter sp. IMCC34836]|uniref:DUF2461 domain-containing protein n=1 Tax=Permianibacter fluminis TaxID=2738515 RepID=UPI0015537A98|nr:DUF2461 domain-containing protein [Permianibacter fluminis]NQD35952.1 DUF2461 domain-containing protein [Permianibacter fluminis]
MSFTEGTFKFLAALAKHNNRDWFEQNKPRYEELVREPALAFIASLQAPMQTLAPQFDVSAKKMGGSLMRVFRDTRFSNDKTPYKTNIGIQFRHVTGKNVHAPGFYIHLSPQECFLGAGMWHPEADALKKIRNYIHDNPYTWGMSVRDKTFRKYFSLEGDSLQRMPRGYSDSHEHAVDLKRKDFIAIHPFATEEALKKSFGKFCLTRFAATEEFMHTLCEAVDVVWK